jgi:hypothetical protein
MPTIAGDDDLALAWRTGGTMMQSKLSVKTIKRRRIAVVIGHEPWSP